MNIQKTTNIPVKYKNTMIGKDEYGPVSFCPERTQNMYNAGAITKEQYDKQMGQHKYYAQKNPSIFKK